MNISRFRMPRAAGLAWLCVAVGSISPSAAQASLAARVQILEDKEEIRNLLIDYGRLLDARDFAGYSRLFAKDGEWSGGFGTTQGPAPRRFSHGR